MRMPRSSIAKSFDDFIDRHAHLIKSWERIVELYGCSDK